MSDRRRPHSKTITGYIVVPHRDGLRREIEERSKKTHRDPNKSEVR